MKGSGGVYQEAGRDNLVGVPSRVVKNRAAGREIGDFITVSRSRPG